MSTLKDALKKGVIYYKDELNDDFNEVGLSRPSVPEGYKYKRTNPVSNVFANILYYGLGVPIMWIACKFHGIKVVNKKYLRRFRHKSGAFIYANHVSISDAWKYHAYVCLPKRVNIIGYSDALSLPGIVRYLVRCFGLLPLPLKTDLSNQRPFRDAVEWYVNDQKQFVLIFPEAHIWPYYTKIRNFLPNSFIYPVKAQAPVIPMVTVWRKSKLHKKPRQTVVIGKPIYPDPSLDDKESVLELHERCLNQMKYIADSYMQYNYIRYIKKED